LDVIGSPLINLSTHLGKGKGADLSLGQGLCGPYRDVQYYCHIPVFWKDGCLGKSISLTL